MMRISRAAGFEEVLQDENRPLTSPGQAHGLKDRLTSTSAGGDPCSWPLEDQDG
jgi:hypothetical protein